MNPLQERLQSFITFLDKSVLSFENQCGIAPGTVSKMSEKSRIKTLEKISRAYPQLNIDWLKTGEGEMLKQVPVVDFHRDNSDGDSLLDSVKILMNDPTVLEKVVKTEDKVCSLELQVQELNRIIASKEQTITAQSERIADLKDRISELQERFSDFRAQYKSPANDPD